MRSSVSSPDETQRRELKIRHTVEYFSWTLRCFICWWNTVSNAWYYSSNKMTLQGEIKDPKMSIFSSDFQTIIKHLFPLYFFSIINEFEEEFSNTVSFLMEKKQETLLHFNSCKPLTTWNHHRITELWFMFHWVFVPEPGKRFLLGIHVWKKKTYLMNFLVRVGFFVKSQERKGFYYKNCGHVHHYVHNYICVIFSF